MIRPTKAAAMGVAVAAALVLGACGGGSSSGGAAPKDKPSSSSTKGSVDLDTEDGTVKYDDGEGNQTEMNIDGSGASLPDGWPKALAPPDSVTITTSSSSKDEGLTLIGETEQTTAEVAAATKAQVTEAGYEVTQETSSDVTGDSYSGFTATKGDQELTVGVSTFSGGGGKTTLSMTLKGAG
ncbi:MAG: hypothetical protein ACTHN0_14430 [Aquihabitans sp.]